jgi:hypothetical protein
VLLDQRPRTRRAGVARELFREPVVVVGVGRLEPRRPDVVGERGEALRGRLAGRGVGVDDLLVVSRSLGRRRPEGARGRFSVSGQLLGRASIVRTHASQSS